PIPGVAIAAGLLALWPVASRLIPIVWPDADATLGLVVALSFALIVDPTLSGVGAAVVSIVALALILVRAITPLRRVTANRLTSPARRAEVSA
ncbi:MAG: hypothetical protein ACREMF_04385, partial [Gemmatimonadales bacterium]